MKEKFAVLCRADTVSINYRVSSDQGLAVVLLSAFSEKPR